MQLVQMRLTRVSGLVIRPRHPQSPGGSNGLPRGTSNNPATAPQPGGSGQDPHPRAATLWGEYSCTGTVFGHGTVPSPVSSTTGCTTSHNRQQETLASMGPPSRAIHNVPGWDEEVTGGRGAVSRVRHNTPGMRLQPQGNFMINHGPGHASSGRHGALRGGPIAAGGSSCLEQGIDEVTIGPHGGLESAHLVSQPQVARQEVRSRRPLAQLGPERGQEATRKQASLPRDTSVHLGHNANIRSQLEWEKFKTVIRDDEVGMGRGATSPFPRREGGWEIHLPLSRASRGNHGDALVWEATTWTFQTGAGAGLQGLGGLPRDPLGEIQHTAPWNGVPRTTQTAPDLREREPPLMDHASAQGRPQSASGLAGHNVPASR